MPKHGKKYNEVAKLVTELSYKMADGIAILKKTSTTKFDASCEVHMQLGVDPRQADQNIRTTVSLPNGTGKDIKVVAFVDDSLVKDALAAGAIEAGTAALVDKIEKGWLDFDVAVATPDQMKALGKIAKTLGQKRLMPNPKAGTVTTEVVKTIEELKRGKVEVRLDKDANSHNVFGKVSFDEAKLMQNLKAIVKSVIDAKPESSKGTYLKSVTLSTTMGPGIPLDVQSVNIEVKN